MLTHHCLFSATAPANGYLRVKQADVAETGERRFVARHQNEEGEEDRWSQVNDVELLILIWGQVRSL